MAVGVVPVSATRPGVDRSGPWVGARCERKDAAMARATPVTGTRTPHRHARPVAAGGWRRAALGLCVGALAGVLAARVLPGPR